MKAYFKNNILRKLLIKTLIKITIIILMLVGLRFGYQYVKNGRTQLFVRQALLEQQPEGILQATALRNELRGRQHDIDRIKDFILTRDDIGQFISAIESVAEKQQVQVRVPEVKPEVKIDKNKNPISEDGPLTEVRIDILAAGRVENLLRFLHAVEHESYLVRVVSWSARAENKSLPGFSSSVPSLGPPSADQQTSTIEPGILEASLLVSVYNDQK